MENQHQYLNYFKANSQKSSIHKRRNSKSFTSQYQLTQQQKLLPHITEQFQFRITNELLDQKIKHPKRDKIIVGSVSKKESLRGTSNSRHGRRLKTSGNARENKENVQEEIILKNDSEFMHNTDGISRWGSKRNQMERCYKTFGDKSSPCHNYMNDYLIALENNRMGRRLINVKSTIQDMLTKNYYTYSVYNGKLANRDKYQKIKRDSAKFKSCNKGFDKINNGIKSFFHKIVKPQQSNSAHITGISGVKSRDAMEALNKTVIAEEQVIKTMRNNHKYNNLVQHGYETNNPYILTTAGQGQYSFIINKMLIHNNPPIKADALLVIQLIEGYHKLTEIVNTSYAQKNNFFKFHCKTQNPQEKHCFTSGSFPYQYLSREGGNEFGIKFKINRHKEIYLRVLKNEGIEQRQLGVIRVNLEHYFKGSVESEFPVKVLNHFKQIDDQMYTRKVYESQIQGKLLKLNKGETSTSFELHYHFYHKSYNKIKYNEFDRDSQTQIIQL